jgi:hypothetical protein
MLLNVLMSSIEDHQRTLQFNTATVGQATHAAEASAIPEQLVKICAQSWLLEAMWTHQMLLHSLEASIRSK